mgnify:CR=1
MSQPLGKGEVESSILSRSTSNPLKSFNSPTRTADSTCASVTVNDSGTAAQNWHTIIPAPRRITAGMTSAYRVTLTKGSTDDRT